MTDYRITWPRPTPPSLNITLEWTLYKTGPPKKLALLWTSWPSVIAGRLSREGLDYDCKAARRHGVPVYRRMTGGGAVVHEPGILVLSLLIPRPLPPREIMKTGTSIILEALERLGIPARVENEGDVVVDGYKVAGSAAHTSRDRSLYHATLIVEEPALPINELTPPRHDRIEKGEVTPAKYRPRPLTGLKHVTRSQVIHALTSVLQGRSYPCSLLVSHLGAFKLEEGMLPMDICRNTRD